MQPNRGATVHYGMPLDGPIDLAAFQRSLSDPTELSPPNRAVTNSTAGAAARGKIGDSAAIREMLDQVLEPAPFRRDFNLIRAILLEAEQPGPHPFTYPDYDRTMVQTHLILLIEAGYAHGNIVRSGNGLTTATLDRLTWSGHDLLALMKDGKHWDDARTNTLDAHGCAHTELLVSRLKELKRGM